MAERMDGQTLVHRILLATARGLTSTTPVDLHLKDKYIEYDAGLTKTFCITVSIQKFSLIHTLIHQILEFHELNDHAHS